MIKQRAPLIVGWLVVTWYPAGVEGGHPFRWTKTWVERVKKQTFNAIFRRMPGACLMIDFRRYSMPWNVGCTL